MSTGFHCLPWRSTIRGLYKVKTRKSLRKNVYFKGQSETIGKFGEAEYALFPGNERTIMPNENSRSTYLCWQWTLFYLLSYLLTEENTCMVSNIQTWQLASYMKYVFFCFKKASLRCLPVMSHTHSTGMWIDVGPLSDNTSVRVKTSHVAGQSVTCQWSPGKAEQP